MDEEAELFEDAVSVTSASSGPAWKKGKDYMSLSRCTIYHSAQDLQAPESDEEQDKPIMASKQSTVEFANSNAHHLTSPSMFQDEGDSVDFVLVWNDANAAANTEAALKKRAIFERRLADDGLKLEHEENQSLHFVKIHAPKEVLMRYSEILKLRMPMKKFDNPEAVEEPSFDIMDEVKSVVQRVMHRITEFVHVDPKVFKPQENRLTAEFSRDKIYLFDVENTNFFTAAVRTTVVDYILERVRFSDDEAAHFAFGVNRLISDGVYSAAYPLHDGDYKQPGCLRYLLHQEWASIRKWIMYQPVDHIKDYFGVKFGLYFAWLGFYTHMLIPAALVGLICFIYGLISMYSNNLSEDICNKNLNIVMCPLCDTCDFWKLSEACDYARVTYLFDNPFTVFFAFFMSFWGTLFLELWKRYSADITHHWGLTGFDVQAEHPRPEYLARLRDAKVRINVITNTKEPYVPFWKVRVPATILSFSVVLLLISVAVAAVFAVVFYRMASVSSQSIFKEEDKRILVPATAALINLVFIMLLNYFYDWLAVKLTELELLRTQTEFDDSLTLKIYLFQFVNYYTSIFYIAFLKGKFVGYPLKYNKIFGMRQEECAPGGCLMELCIQLAIIMVGKQAYNTILEMVIPLLYKWWNTFQIKTGLKAEEKETGLIKNQWTEDFKLLDYGPRGLFPEYLEMVLQYGFITIFVAAFPLAPFFALLNNVLEMRLDAKKFLRFYRRPVPRRVKSIGVWFRILDIIGRISVVTNAFIIAFSSNFIPRMVYMMTVNRNHTDVGYLNHSLAYFNTSDYQDPQFNITGYPICRYPEYRNAPWDPQPYKRPPIYWHILAARLAFVVVFQNVVSVMMMAVQWLIPDTSRQLRDEMRKEAYLTSEIIITQERKRAQAMNPNMIGSGDFLKGERNPVGNHNVVHRRRNGTDPEEIGLTEFHTEVA